jgi:hypothetical protein
MAANQQVIPSQDDWEDVDWEDVTAPKVAPSVPIQQTNPALTDRNSPEFQGDSNPLVRGWHAISDPLTDIPSRIAKSVGDYIDSPSLTRSPMAARVQGFGAGALQGLGDVISGMTSPINIATMGAGALEKSALLEGMPQLARMTNIGGRVAGGLTASHGAAGVLDPNASLSDRAFSLAELAGGSSQMFAGPKATSSSKPQLTGAPPTKEAGVNFATKAEANAAKAPPMPQKGLPQTTGEASTAGLAAGVVDPFAKYRQVPVGTVYKISPENFNRRVATEAMRLGFQYQDMDSSGKIIMKKVSESPSVQQPRTKANEDSIALQVSNLPRTLMASMDMSAPLRQGLGLIHKKAFWTALPDMVKSFGSEDAYTKVKNDIYSDPIFQRRFDPSGKLQPSFAEKAGLKLTDLDSMTTREESMMSKYAEKIPFVRASNRAYVTFLNKLRTDTFKQMTADFGTYGGPGAKNNISASRAIADFINNASGRGSLGKAEPAAKILSSVLFSPRLIASRLQMMTRGTAAVFSPQTYLQSGPNIRREYLKSLMSIAAATSTFAELSKLAGGEVENDPASSDFRKVRFGDTRIDPYGGFQQYIVLAQRLLPELDLSKIGLDGLAEKLGIGETLGGRMKSTTTGEQYSLTNPGYGQSTKADVLGRFIRSKTNPIANFGWGLLAAQKELSGKEMNLTAANPFGAKGENLFDNSIAQRFIPMLMQDVYDLARDESTPTSAKGLAAFLASLGTGVQTYEGQQ